MKIGITNLPKSEIELKIEVPAEEFQEFFDEAAKELSRELKIEGFRPGHATSNLVEEKVGAAKILEEAAQHCVHKCYVKAILDNKIEALGRPEISITKIAKDNPFEFKARVAVLPQVKLPDYKKIARKLKGEKKEAEVKQEEVSQAIDWLKKSRAKYKTVNRPAREGDRVEIDFEGSCEGEKLKELASKNQPAILGKGYFMPGFEENILGMKEGETKQFNLFFPENFEHKHLAGKIVDFETKMNLVQEEELPELNDDFARGLGNFKDLNALKENIKEGLLMEKQKQEKERWRAKLIEEIVKKSEMEIPQVLIESETERLLDELKFNVEQMKLSYDDYLKRFKKTEAELKKEFEEKALQRIRAFVVLKEIAKQEKIEISENEIEKEANKTLKHFQTPQQAEQKVDIKQLKMYTEDILKNEKVFQLLESC